MQFSSLSILAIVAMMPTISATPRTARDALRAPLAISLSGSARSFTKLRILGGGGMDALAPHLAEEA